ANDGIISTASLLIGVSAAHTAHSGVLIAGVAALTAGAMSMAAGEYISVKSQADTEDSEIQREKKELKNNFPAETEELTSIYIKYALDHMLATQVATQLMKKYALGAHIRDELGITKALKARPLQAALFSACSFSIGSSLPILVTIFASANYLIPIVFLMAVFFLALLGGLAAKIGGSRIIIGAARVTLWGTLAMLITALTGSLLGTFNVL
ncbi:MAG: VIT family protein, partial [Gammaproteobacteria bacterium]|nr:VIT family protein [Gammaproteobacteria bacterium]